MSCFGSKLCYTLHGESLSIFRIFRKDFKICWATKKMRMAKKEKRSMTKQPIG